MKAISFLRTHVDEQGSSVGSLKAPYQSKDQQVSLIRKELLELTGNHFRAIILNQLLYWTQRVKDFDLFLEEEKNFNPKNSALPQHGWIYKTSNDLIQETLLCINRTTMRRHLKFLIQRGWVYERSNPSNKWDKTVQYRVNLRQIQRDLLAIECSLPDVYLKGFLLEEPLSKFAEKLAAQNEPSKGQVIPFRKNEKLPRNHEILPKDQNAPSKVQNNLSIVHNAPSNVQNCSFIYLNRDYSENTNKDHTQRSCVRDSQRNLNAGFFEEILKIWEKYVGQEAYLTSERKSRLQSLLTVHFQNDLSHWEAFCKQIKASPFLMGEGPSKWHVNFDWILSEKNILKVLEGNFDSPEEIQRKKEERAKLIREEKTKEILESIEDPLWREWCHQLSEFPPQEYRQITTPLYWWQLERIAQARFLEFDGRLAIIGSAHQKVLGAIEERRYQIASIVARTYPTSRSIGTQLLHEINESPTNTANQENNLLLNNPLNSPQLT